MQVLKLVRANLIHFEADLICDLKLRSLRTDSKLKIWLQGIKKSVEDSCTGDQ